VRIEPTHDVARVVVSAASQLADWVFNPTNATIILTALTLLVVLRQLQLMGLQQETMRQQLEIMRHQEELLGRHAILVLFVENQTLDGGRVRLVFGVRNDGTRGVRDFYWHVFIPDALRRFGTTFSYDSEKFIWEQQAFFHAKGFARDPLYQERTARFGSITVDQDARGKFTILWRMIAEDGRFPPQEIAIGPVAEGEKLGVAEVEI
jgi:hypothetical protein